MRATAQAAQHRARAARVARLAEHVAVHDDDRVGGDDHRAGFMLGDRVGLRAREPLGVRDRRLARQQRLVDVGRPHLVLDADEREQLAAPRRRRGEDDAREWLTLISPARA